MAKRIKILNCDDCLGQGFIVAKTEKTKHLCILCNGKGSTLHGPFLSETEKTMSFKIAWDYINGKKEGWYH